MNFYELKAVYNPLSEDVIITCSSPADNEGEEYVIEAKGIILLPATIAKAAALSVAREVLQKHGKEFDDPSRQELEEEILSHQFEIIDSTRGVGTIKEEVPIKKGGKK
jgi:N-dimethylarginine dimethylaminohydrolase